MMSSESRARQHSVPSAPELGASAIPRKCRAAAAAATRRRRREVNGEGGGECGGGDGGWAAVTSAEAAL